MESIMHLILLNFIKNKLREFQLIIYTPYAGAPSLYPDLDIEDILSIELPLLSTVKTTQNTHKKRAPIMGVKYGY